MADATVSITALLHLDRHFPWIQNYLGGHGNTPLSVHVRAFLKQLGPKDSAKPSPGKDALKFSHGDFGPIPMLLFELHKFLLFYERGTGSSEETVLCFCFLIWEDDVSLESEDVEQTFAPGWVGRNQREFDGPEDVSTCWQSCYGAAESWRSRIIVWPLGSQFMVGREFSTVIRATVAGKNGPVSQMPACTWNTDMTVCVCLYLTSSGIVVI